MSRTLVVELNDDIYAAIEHQAVAANTSPSQVVVTSLEQQFGRRAPSVRDVLIQAGLTTGSSEAFTDTPPMTNEQRRVLAQEGAHGRPLSDYIREERDER